jgi:RNase P subunit RPR2
MAEKAYKAETFLIEYHCDKCNTPIVQKEPHGMRIDNGEPIFIHECLKCRKEYEFNGIKYPYTQVRYVRGDSQ